ncbi:hypothetical protein GALL_125300 [mine drainage metagenome]|uniref:Uncharacterized protein n=1 Tax=mine drainage metagenome TaxID=410659 RepID=A0A1J5SZS0_9ZZZZ
MGKWISLILLILFSVPSLLFALDDNGGSLIDLFFYLCILLSIFFAILTFISFRKRYKLKKSRVDKLFMLIPIVLIIIYFIFYALTSYKINKPYFLKASHPSSSHNFIYYFRSDSTLRTYGNFVDADGNTFQNFKLRGDTIILDTFFYETGLEAKKYLKTVISDSISSTHKVLIPLNKYGKINSNLTILDVKE